VKQAAKRNYFSSHQAVSLIEPLAYRKAKMEVATLIYPRVVDQGQFGQVRINDLV